MLKLLNRDVSPPRYWETWEDSEGSHTIHFGVIGDNGYRESLKDSFFTTAEKKIKAIIDKKIQEGFQPIGLEDMKIVLIEYQVDGLGNDKDLEKRHRLEDRMNETLGWTGLGHCDGGSIGSDTMEVCNYVVDVDIAKTVIANDLVDTEFENYTRIFQA